MKSGRYRFRVDIEQYTDAQDSAGQPIKTWLTFAQRKASIDPIDPIRTPFFRADERFEPETFRIGIRYLPGLTKYMRVVSGPTIYEILNIAPDAKTMRREQVLTCRTGLDENASMSDDNG